MKKQNQTKYNQTDRKAMKSKIKSDMKGINSIICSIGIDKLISILANNERPGKFFGKNSLVFDN